MSIVVRCRENSLANVPPAFLDSRRGIRPDSVVPLTVGQLYVVFAVTSFVGGFWYYLFDDDRHAYPVWYPAPIFEVISSRIPSGWILAHHHLGKLGMSSILSFPEWASDPHFYEKLVDGDAATVAAFKQAQLSTEESQEE